MKGWAAKEFRLTAGDVGNFGSWIERSTRHLEAVYPCPKCGGTGRWRQPPCEHNWHLVASYGGPSFNLQTYACINDGCDAALCSDCASEGLPTCEPVTQETLL